ncbi:restriction endonuclease subunit S [Amaricoccus sp. W119]|uniref:restriction endonuclease subunit S n=1 Tax=Amaricoccus sp. W119 TaxID=3391833 RepID=UPI0039A63C2B
MNEDRLLAHYEKIADAPDAIALLRRFILDLAVRGKLVPQDASDEPASELRKRIAKEKARLVKAGELRKPRDLDSGDDVVEPYSIPSTWQWVRLDGAGAIVGGGTPSASDADNFAEPGEGVPWLTPADLGGYSGLYISRGSRDLSERGARTSSATLMPEGTVLFTSRAPIGYVAIAANPISTNQGFKSIVPYVADCSRFIATVMKAFAPAIDAKAPGTTFKEVSGKIVAAVPFPLPPLAEQHRIVAKVDELMGLCDRLEAARAGREAVRDRLAAASLARLSAPDPATFQTDARFALDALPALTTRPDQIKALRQIILNLAVRGRLLPQDPNDEPASELLKSVANRKAQLLEARRIKSDRPLPPIREDETPFPLPKAWVWARAQDLSLKISDGVHKKPNYVASGVPFVTVKNLTQGPGISFRETRFITEDDHAEFTKRTHPEKGDVLITKDGTIGVSRIVDTDRAFSIFVSVALIKMVIPGIAPFLTLCINSDVVRDTIIPKGAALKHLHLVDLRNLPLPLPPLPEQHRIISKVDALMALCDQLEASLTATAATRRRLLDALLAEALAPTEDRELEAAE